ncbi:MAG: zinc ribbon domain-containing protein [Lachnospiraceae bacterium]|nr:zinc ribbon domain-containing protein [Lachnospiraceae bacterium]
MDYCTKCGAPLKEGAAFCSKCGNSAAVQNTPRKKSHAWSVFLLLGLIIGAAATSIVWKFFFSAPSKNYHIDDQIEGNGYDSSEEAVKAYVEYLKAGDLKGALSVFAVESYAEHFDLEAYYENLMAYQPYDYEGYRIPLAARTDLSKQLNKESRRGYLVKQMYMQYMNALVSEYVDDEKKSQFDNTMIRLSDKRDVDDVLSFIEIDPGLKSIEIKASLSPGDLGVSSRDSQKTFAQNREKTWGAEQVDSVSLDIMINEKEYILFMTTVCYNGKWYVADFNNAVGYSMGASALHAGLEFKGRPLR